MHALKLRIENSLNLFQEISGALLLKEDQIQSLYRLSDELKSEASLASIRLDPYWPKWTSPWWKVILLHEVGYKHLIPRDFLDNFIEIIDAHYLHLFPLTKEEIPEGCDPYRGILCQCALGNMYKVLEECGFNVHFCLSWWFDWFNKYQLPDGGYNCEESAYSGSLKSSFLSTIPMLEAMLVVFRKTQDVAIKALLQKGANYMLKHGLYKSTKGEIIDEAWLQASFPRFYDYDILRGFSFIVEWAFQTKSELPADIVADCLDRIEGTICQNGFIILGKNKISREGSLFYSDEKWTWKEQSESFTALDLFGQENDMSVPLTVKWYDTLKKLDKVVLV